MSDTHNMTHKLPYLLPQADVFLHGGDFSKTGTPEQVQEFVAFLRALPYSLKIVIAGNHELTFDEASYNAKNWQRFHPQKHNTVETKRLLTSLRSEGIIYLEDESYVHPEKKWKVYGSPWQPEFWDWGFNLPRGQPLKEVWDKIPIDTNILITHGPPHNILDATSTGQNVGCEELRKRMDQLDHTVLHLFGHIHEAYGVKTVGSKLYVNASTVDLNYKPIHEPILVDVWNDGKKWVAERVQWQFERVVAEAVATVGSGEDKDIKASSDKGKGHRKDCIPQ